MIIILTSHDVFAIIINDKRWFGGKLGKIRPSRPLLFFWSRSPGELLL